MCFYGYNVTIKYSLDWNLECLGEELMHALQRFQNCLYTARGQREAFGLILPVLDLSSQVG